MPTYDILTTSIPHRHESLCLLLAELDRQIRPGVGMILYRDDLEVPYGDKTQALIEASSADYVASIDDDDMVAPNYLSKIMEALSSEPDYVGFMVRWTQNGQPQRPVIHSLRCAGWIDRIDQLDRDITQFNPIRRELALLATWAGGHQAERRWSDQLRAIGKVKEEVFIDEPLYWYQECIDDTFMTRREPLGTMPELPSYPWLRQIGPYA